MDVIRVGVVSAARTLRIGLREVLNNLPGLCVVSEGALPGDLAGSDADVLVVASPTRLDSFESAGGILLLTDDPAEAREFFRQPGPARGVLPPEASEDELRAAIGALAEGMWVAASTFSGEFPARQPGAATESADIQSLTAREDEVLQLAAQGLANKQIALRLGISEHTVKFHLSALYAKLGVTSRTEAVRSGARLGLVVF